MAVRFAILTSCMFISIVMMTATLPIRADANPGWSPFERIDINDFGISLSPSLAMNEAGDAVAVWDQRAPDANESHIWANAYSFEEGWGNAVLIESDDVGYSYVNDVAIDSDGNAMAIWTQWYPSNSTWYVCVSNYSEGVGWGTPQRLNPASAGSGVGGRVVFDDLGNAFTAWLETPNVYSSRYVPGLGWGSPELIEHQIGWSQVPDIAVDKHGNAIAVWEAQTSNRYNIWSNRYEVGSGWGLEELLETNDSGDAFTPAVAVDEEGNAISVWEQGNVPYTEHPIDHIWSNRYVAGVGWGTAELIEENSTASSGHATVAMFRSGDAIAAWCDYTNSTSGVWTCRFSTTNGWASPEPLGVHDDSFSHDPQLAINREGRALVVWQNYTNYMSSRCTARTAWTDPETALDAMTALSNYSSVTWPQHHQVCIDDRGNGLIVWDMTDRMRVSMYASTYLAPPPSIELTSPTDNSTVHEPLITVSGFTDPLSELVVNGTSVAVEENGSFSTSILLARGSNQVAIVATDSAGRSTSVTVHVFYQKNKPLDLPLILGAVLIAAIALISLIVLYHSARRRRISEDPRSEKREPPARP